MRDIARGMRDLHEDKIAHRGLKAANVLVKVHDRDGRFKCLVADYECSVGVMGPRFWRSPEHIAGADDRQMWRGEDGTFVHGEIGCLRL